MAQKKRILGSLIAASFDTLLKHPIILFPFCILAFLKLFALEIIYFIPRWPLNILFAPIVRTLWGEQFLHYPINFLLIPKLFYYTQLLLYVLIEALLTAASCVLIYNINEGKPTNLKTVFKKTFKKYIEIFCIAIITIGCFFILRSLYGFIVAKIATSQIGAEIYFVGLIKKGLAYTLPYGKFFLGILVELLFVYAIPILILNDKKLLSALGSNFKFLKNTYIITFMLVALPALLLLPLLYMNMKIAILIDKTSPAIILALAASEVVLTLFINAFTTTMIVSFYLSKRKT